MLLPPPAAPQVTEQGWGEFEVGIKAPPLPRHFPDTSQTLPRHFPDTSYLDLEEHKKDWNYEVDE